MTPTVPPLVTRISASFLTASALKTALKFPVTSVRTMTTVTECPR